MATPPRDDSNKLPMLMGTLPQELFDKIYAFTFTCDDREDIRIDEDYSPPATLQVDRATRRALARDYYSEKHFHATNTIILRKWLCSLPRKHLELLKDVELGIAAPYASTPASDEVESDDLRFEAAQKRMNMLHVELDQRGIIVFPRGFLYASVWETVDGVLRKGPPCRAKQVLGVRMYWAFCKKLSLFLICRSRS